MIILVLALMFSEPLLNYQTYQAEKNTSYQFGLDLLRDFFFLQ